MTHPLLSSRVPFSLDPSNSSKFADKGDRVYLVHEDQDRVWLAIGTKAIGNIAWEDEEYLLSDLLPRAWDPCIGLLDIGTDTMLFVAFVGRDGQVQRDRLFALYLDPDDLGHTILAPRAIYTPSSFDVSLFNLDVSMAYPPTAHLVWEEHWIQGANRRGQVKYGSCNLNTLAFDPAPEDVDGSWNVPANTLPVPYSCPDVELNGDAPWIASLHEGPGAVIRKKYGGDWVKVYSSASAGFSGNMKDYAGFDFGVAPPGSPAWPFLAFAYQGEGIYLASYNGASWDHIILNRIVGASSVSEPAVSWSHDTALVTWKGTEGLSNYLKGLLVTRNGWTGVSLSPGTLNFPAQDPHVLYENSYVSMLWEEANPSDPPAYWIKWRRWVPTEIIHPAVDVAIKSITGPIGGNYTLYYTTDPGVSELWFLLSRDQGNTFPDRENPPCPGVALDNSGFCGYTLEVKGRKL